MLSPSVWEVPLNDATINNNTIDTDSCIPKDRARMFGRTEVLIRHRKQTEWVRTVPAIKLMILQTTEYTLAPALSLGEFRKQVIAIIAVQIRRNILVAYTAN